VNISEVVVARSGRIAYTENTPTNAVIGFLI
jgi:hypothetical protein